MHTSFDLRSALVTQKSKRQPLIYDQIQAGIDATIQELKNAQKNAIVRNLAYSINGQLVLAQLFINRLNGFVPTEEAKFGTTPTAYNIQLRFVHGYQTLLGNQPIFISNGSFAYNNLVPHRIGDHITDDIYHEMSLIPGPNVTYQTNYQTLTLGIQDSPNPLKLSWRQDLGTGYETFERNSGVFYYFTESDYNQRHKTNTIYALGYATPEQGIYRWHPEYQGYTEHQNHEHEPRSYGATERLHGYRRWIKGIDTSLQQHPISQQWATHHQQSLTNHTPYRLDILCVNGMYLYSDSGLAVDRLYDYQVELVQLFTQVYQRIRTSNQINRLPDAVHASIVDMGVGAGKTYIINTVLKFLSRFHRDPNYAPAFCMTPDKALADVMVRVINKQDGLSQIRSTAITSAEDIPDASFLQRYQEYSQIAVKDIIAIKTYLCEGIQTAILQHCKTVGLHPFVIMNGLYDTPGQCRLYQNSIDIKRLILLIEGQKLIMQKTGLSPVIALRRLYDELEKIITSVDNDNQNPSSLFKDIQKPITPTYPDPRWQISYGIEVTLPLSLQTAKRRNINLKDMTPELLHQLLLTKFDYKRHSPLQQLSAIRDVLLKIACLSDIKAAILLANGGGLANTHTREQLTEQIQTLLAPATNELRRGAEQTTPMTYLEHRCYFLYLNEIFSTVPTAIDARTAYRNAFDNQLLTTSLRHNYQLLHNLRQAIGERLAMLAQPQPRDSRYGMTVVEAVDQMAGHMGLVLSDRAIGDAASLLATHVPVFAPEGFVAYLENLCQREGQPLITMTHREGVYLAQQTELIISRAHIQQRLTQIFSALMLADEIHKEAYQFMYDPNHPLYQRINQITTRLLNQEFGNILPHRIGMSGTVNQIAKSAFGDHTLYSLPLQDMIQRDLTKSFQVTTLTQPSSGSNLWKDYFRSNPEWNSVSKTIVFSKHAMPPVDLNLQESQPELKQNHQNAIRNQLFVHYLEFILQKSGASKELSELVGLQNKLHVQRASLLFAFQHPESYHDILQSLSRTIQSISPDLISEIDVKNYAQRALHSPQLQDVLTQLIMAHKTNFQALAEELERTELPVCNFATHDPHEFEDGQSQILMGTEAQQTGYSHEFVGTIVDASRLAMLEPIQDMHRTDNLSSFYRQSQDLLLHSFSYDEKNQIAGRALRTSDGKATYLEYLSPYYARDFQFNIETSFSDILIEDKEQAKTLRTSVMFNRHVLGLLSTFDGTFDAFVDHVIAHCQTHRLLGEYQHLMAERLPAWWALKGQTELVETSDFSVLSSIVTRKLAGARDVISSPPERNNQAPGWESRQIHQPIDTPHAGLWLRWMIHPAPVAIGVVLLLAGISALSAVGLGYISSTLIANCAKGTLVAGALLILPIVSNACYTFFQRRARNNEPNLDIAAHPLARSGL